MSLFTLGCLWLTSVLSCLVYVCIRDYRCYSMEVDRNNRIRAEHHRLERYEFEMGLLAERQNIEPPVNWIRDGF